MASKMIFMTGTAKWTKLDKADPKYNNYTIDLYLDQGGREVYENSGLDLTIREDKETGEEFIKLRRNVDKLLEGMPEKPAKLIFDKETKEYVPFDKLIGNGSFVTVKVNVYDSQRGKGHRLEAVAVENLIAYEGQDDSDIPF